MYFTFMFSQVLPSGVLLREVVEKLFMQLSMSVLKDVNLHLHHEEFDMFEVPNINSYSLVWTKSV